MRYVIPVEITVEATGPEHALANARKVRELLGDAMVQSIVRSEGITAVGIAVRAPSPAAPTTPASTAGQSPSPSQGNGRPR